MMAQSVEDLLKVLLEKADRILSLLESPGTEPRSRTATRLPKQKRIPASAEEIAGYQEQFDKLFGTWDAGEELQVEKELNAMSADELRRFADANNLNVTSKTSKQKIMRLIAGRFRERRQLLRTHFNRR